MYARPVVISNSGAGTPDLEIEHTTDDRPDTPGLEEAVKKVRNTATQISRIFW